MTDNLRKEVMPDEPRTSRPAHDIGPAVKRSPGPRRKETPHDR
jgi:hypothetical protein